MSTHSETVQHVDASLTDLLDDQDDEATADDGSSRDVQKARRPRRFWVFGGRRRHREQERQDLLAFDEGPHSRSGRRRRGHPGPTVSLPRGGRPSAFGNTTPAEAAPVRPERATSRGWKGRGGGYVTRVEPTDEYRGTTTQVCGLWPFVAGAGTPMVGVPIGKHQLTGATLCCDPISWFQPERGANLINNPSVFVLGLPGLGKSTVIRRMATGLSANGVIPLALGDLKPDYVRMVEALGGQIITLGRGRDRINILDPGEAARAARRLRAAGFDKEAEQVLADAHKRRRSMLEAVLLLIMSERRYLAREMMVVDAALKLLDRHEFVVPQMEDLYRLVQAPPPELRAAALDRGDLTRYQEITEDLEASLRSLVSGDGALGDTFSGATTTPMRMDVPVCFDVSSTGEDEDALAAALLLACWSTGFATVNIAQVLADVGLEPRRHYLAIVDELWRVLQMGGRVVHLANSTTRLNRQQGVGVAWASHTMKDLESLALEEDRMKARGFVERAGIVILGGLPEAEMPRVNKAVTLTAAEEQELTKWSAPGAWNSALGRSEDPPGRGKFLIKVGARPGIPVHVELTQVEKAINDTNVRWHDLSRVGSSVRDTLHDYEDTDSDVTDLRVDAAAAAAIDSTAAAVIDLTEKSTMTPAEVIDQVADDLAAGIVASVVEADAPGVDDSLGTANAARMTEGSN